MEIPVTAALIGIGLACTTVFAATITSPPQSQSLYVGHTLQLSVGVSGLNPGFQWLKDGAEIPGARSVSYVLPNAQTTNSGGYSVVVTNVDGAVTSAVAQVVVRSVAPLTEQLAGYWKLDETSGTTVADSSGGGHPGIVVNNAGDQWIGGQVGGAMNFRGPSANDHIAVTNLPMPAGNSFSVAFWVWRDPGMLTADAWRMLYFNNLDGPFSVRDDPGTGRVRPGVYQANSNLVAVADPTPLASNTWTHYVMLADGSRFRVYRNGSEVASAAYDGTLRKTVDSPNTLVVGGFFNPGLTAKFWQGKFDDIGYWTRALTADEVQLVYAAGYSRLGFSDLNLAAGQNATNWVTYNDLGANYTAPNTAGWVTASNVSGNTWAMANVSGPPPMAVPLTNYLAGQYPVAEFPSGFGLEGRAALIMVGTGNGVFTVPAGDGTTYYPFPETPGYNLFHGIVDLGNSGSLYGVGSGQYVLHVFTNLNPAARYSFRGTVARNGTTVGTHDVRWTLCSITGARSFTDAHTPGTLTASTVLTGLALTNGQVAFQTGINTNGQVVGWDEIQPGTDGTFTVVNQPYNGVTDHASASANIGYILAGLLLTEQSPLSPVVITSPLAATNGALQNLPFTLSIQARGTAPQFQWYKEGEGAIAGATLASYHKSQAILADSGTYYVVVSNRFGSVTNSTYLDVVNDTTPPTFVTTSGNATMNQVVLQFSEIMDSNLAGEPGNYEISDGVNPFGTVSAIVTNNGTTVILTTETQAENTLYTVSAPTLTDLAGNAVGNTGQFRSWVFTGTNGGLVFEFFNNISGTPVANLTNSPTFPNNPTAVYRLPNGFNTRQIFPDNSHDNYGGRIYGLFIPPFSGAWRFYIHSDDASVLYLNPTGPNIAGKVLIAQETACCNAYSAPPSPRTSAAIPLTAGQAYYIEGLYKEGNGGDYMQVAARLDGTGLPSIGANTDPFLDVETIPGAWTGSPYIPAGAGGSIMVTQLPTNASVENNGLFTFSIAATSSSGFPLGYQWSRWDGGAFTNIPNATTASYSNYGVLADSGARFQVTVTLPGTVGRYEAALTVHTDTTPPKLLSAQGDESMKKIILHFSELMDPVTANEVGNYALSGDLGPASAALGSDGKTVTIILDPNTLLQPNTLYTVTAAVQDLAGNPAVAPDDATTFRSFVLSPGYVNFALYDTSDAGSDCVAQQHIPVLTNHPSYPNNPTLRAFASAFTSRLILTDTSRERFGARMSGFFIPPVTGNWMFYISGDDDAELWLNPTGTDPDAALPIIIMPGCCQAPSAHPSAPISLTAGRAYFIKGLYKEGCGGDYMYVVAKHENDPANPDSIGPIPGDYLACYVDPLGASLSITQQPGPVTVVLSQPLIKQDFKSGDGGYVSAISGTSPAGGWTYDAVGGVWYANGDDSGPTSSTLTGPSITVSQAGPLVLSFNHRYSFEFDGTRWDGGQVRMSINGGAFTTIPSNAYTANGYIGTISGTGILQGQPGFNEASPGYSAGVFITSVANLGNFAAGSTVAFQFVGTWDEGTTAAQPNWVIANILLISQQSVVQDFNTTDGGYAASTTGTTPTGGWTYDATGGFWYANGDDSGPTASTLTSPAITVLSAGSFNLSFKHRYNFEYDGTRWDGGQVRISVNGGPFNTVPAINFSAGGYDGTISGTGVLNGQPGYNGTSPGYATSNYITSSAFLGGFAAGDTLAVQFVGAWDEGTAVSPPDWVIDSVSVIQGGAEPATFRVGAQGTTPGQTNLLVSYQWQRDNGDGFINIPGANQASLTFLPVGSDNLAFFRCVLRAPGVTDAVVSQDALLTVVGGSGPVLRLRPSPVGSMIFSWPAIAGDYVLEETTQLQVPPAVTVWTPSGATPDVVGNRKQVAVPTTGPQKFYHLKK